MTTAGTAELSNAIRALTPTYRVALLQSIAERASTSDDNAVSRLWLAIGAVLVEEIRSLQLDAGAVLLAAADVISAAAVDELGARFLDADGNEIPPAA